MLIRFKFQNYRSFRDENILSMEAKGNSEYKNCLIPYKKKRTPSCDCCFWKKRWWKE